MKTERNVTNNYDFHLFEKDLWSSSKRNEGNKKQKMGTKNVKQGSFRIKIWKVSNVIFFIYIHPKPSAKNFTGLLR